MTVLGCRSLGFSLLYVPCQHARCAVRTLISSTSAMQGTLTISGPSAATRERQSATLACCLQLPLPPPLWAPHRRHQARVHASTHGELSADWDEEMSIFKKRTLAPNQLETLRTIEATVDVGKVP